MVSPPQESSLMSKLPRLVCNANQAPFIVRKVRRETCNVAQLREISAALHVGGCSDSNNVDGAIDLGCQFDKNTSCICDNTKHKPTEQQFLQAPFIEFALLAGECAFKEVNRHIGTIEEENS